MGAAISSLLLGLSHMFQGAVLRVLVKSLAVSLVVFALVALAGWFALDWALAASGLDDSLFSGAGVIREALSAVLAILGLWLTWRIVAMGVIQFFADDVVLAIEARDYPAEAGRARNLSPGEQTRNALGSAGRALLANLIALPFALLLLFTGVGTFALFWLVNAVLLGRELNDMVWLRHRQDRHALAPVGRGQRFVLGLVIAGLLAIPFVNFFAPMLGAAAATHLVHRAARKERPA